MKSFSDYCEFRNAQESLFHDIHPKDKLSGQPAGRGSFDRRLPSDDEEPNKLLSMAEKLKWIAIHGPESIRKKLSDVLSSNLAAHRDLFQHAGGTSGSWNYSQARKELIRNNEEKRKKAADPELLQRQKHLLRRSDKPYH